MPCDPTHPLLQNIERLTKQFVAGRQLPGLLTSQLCPALLQEDACYPRQHRSSASPTVPHFPQQKAAACQPATSLRPLPFLVPLLQPCFVFVCCFVLFSLSHGLWFSYFLGKSHPSKRQPESVVFFREQFKQMTGTVPLQVPLVAPWWGKLLISQEVSFACSGIRSLGCSRVQKAESRGTWM